mmetsp:Transcript_358/g.896  ORF Transcript_358/g.896 Transcript_358/m.896 type:complete len:236 (-) Transcript_358:53-760(-)
MRPALWRPLQRRAMAAAAAPPTRTLYPTGQHMDEPFDVYQKPANAKVVYGSLADVDAMRTAETLPRAQVHAEGVWHRSVHVWCLERGGANAVLLQRRSEHKDTHPSLLDVSCAGHVTAGEASLPTASKELHEELGMLVPEGDLNYLFSVAVSKSGATAKHGAFECNEYQDIYAHVVGEGELLASAADFGEGEVSEVTTVTLAELRERLEGEHPDHVPIPPHYLDEFFPRVAMLLA